MIQVRRYTDLSNDEVNMLERYLKEHEIALLPYQLLPFVKVIDDTFAYPNYSLVAFDEHGTIVGFVPQWLKGRQIESVPWRDKGGPVYDNKKALDAMCKATMQLFDELPGLMGIVWKDSICKMFSKNSPYVNVDISLNGVDLESYWHALPPTVKRMIKQAERNRLFFRVVQNNGSAINNFYNLFLDNRKNLGVPVYPRKMFEAYCRYYSPENIKIFEVTSDENEVLSSMIMLYTSNTAIYAYAASNMRGKEMRSNHCLIYNAIRFCIDNGIRKFDFGSDSQAQSGLIKFKLKWGGSLRSPVNSYYGKVCERDSNRAIYALPRFLIRHLPNVFHRTISRCVVR